MKLHRFQDIQSFGDRAKAYLLQQEVAHCLLLNICHTLICNPEYYDTDPYLAIVEEQGKISAVALRTPPYKLLISAVTNLRAIDLIARDFEQYLHKTEENCSGVSSFPEESKTFVKTWNTLTGQTLKPGLKLQIHQLNTVRSLPRSPGFLRVANSRDRHLLMHWLFAFNQEVFPSFKGNLERTIDQKLNESGIYLWEDHVPVAMAWYRTATENTAILGPVYTPPEYRKQGYATSCVSELSQQLLDQGFQNCSLFTDITNPNTDRLYSAIGYQPISNWYDYNIN